MNSNLALRTISEARLESMPNRRITACRTAVSLALWPPSSRRPTTTLRAEEHEIPEPHPGSPERPSAGPAPRWVDLDETEILRRLNGVLEEKLNPRQRMFVVDNGLRPRWRNAQSRRLTLPQSDYDWVAERATMVVEQLKERGHPHAASGVDYESVLALASPRRVTIFARGEVASLPG